MLSTTLPEKSEGQSDAKNYSSSGNSDSQGNSAAIKGISLQHAVRVMLDKQPDIKIMKQTIDIVVLRISCINDLKATHSYPFIF